jgi:integrative and conjugative element protein (TIGR02256 family)
MNDYNFKMTNGGHLKIDAHCIRTMRPYIQTKPDMDEAGGVLLGRFITHSKNIVIDKVSVPMFGDKRTRTTFKRLSPMHQLFIDKEWQESKGTCNYLGEWHTHPEQDPWPSGVDTRDWKRKLKTDIFSSRFLYFVIAGTKQVRIWEGDRRTYIIEQLDSIKIADLKE